MSGITSYLAGEAAEQQVASRYEGSGAVLLHKRWRARGGEIDLILEDANGLIFVEVKKSKSLARAAERLGNAQIGRLWSTAEAYLAQRDLSLDTNLRFDVALVDQQGHIEIIQNALAA